MQTVSRIFDELTAAEQAPRGGKERVFKITRYIANDQPGPIIYCVAKNKRDALAASCTKFGDTADPLTKPVTVDSLAKAVERMTPGDIAKLRELLASRG